MGKNRAAAMQTATVAAGEPSIYHKAKMWQIILFSLNALSGMGVYMLVGMASYSASIGYGIATVTVGIILSFTRIFDAITDPLLAFVYDRVNTRHGKLRILMISGWVIEAAALLFMFNFASSKGHGAPMFIFLYMVYVIGYTCNNMTVQTIPALLTNDPKQRPTIGVWGTVFNYLIPMLLTIILNVVLLPMFGGTYNQDYLDAAAYFCLGLAFVGLVCACISVRDIDKPESFEGLKEHKEKLSIKSMAEVLAHNHPLQCYIVSAASDKIAQQTMSQSIVSTLMFGVVIGNMGLSTILSVISMLPSILFAALGAKYAGKHGNKQTIVTWTWVSMIFACLMVVFLALIDTTSIATVGPTMIGYVILNLLLNGAKMCVTTGDSAFMADIIDYEQYRSGNYVPAVVTGTYSLIDKLVSAFSAAIAAGCVALVGYHNTMPQPGDTLTRPIFWMAMFLMYGLSILGWICTLVAMRFCHLDKEAMIKVQTTIAEKKKELSEAEKTEAAVQEAQEMESTQGQL